MKTNTADGRYEVLSPWAEADPKPLRGITPRIADLSNKKIGLYCNAKRAALPVNKVVAEKLKAQFPGCEISWYFFTRVSLPEIETNKDKFEEWIKGVDAVVAAVGD
jgi:hypothetical protein